uniref:Glycosyl transferase family 1 domain-containing protein n=1 Tax=Bionectria ochroleuca TaxID=29856 RepID=A0A8H7K7B8_BIOOC
MRRGAFIAQTDCPCHLALTKLYCGISAVVKSDGTFRAALAIYDALYLRDFHDADVVINDKTGFDGLTDHLIDYLKSYERGNLAKFIGCGVLSSVLDHSKLICSRLWLELDIVPIVIPAPTETRHNGHWIAKPVDELADSMARKSIMCFGPSTIPRLQVGWHGVVQVSLSGLAHLARLQDYKGICSPGTWETMTFYADKIRERRIKVAFFSASPQGGGVPIARHALIRFASLLGLPITWQVPKPRRGVFGVTKAIKNILRGVEPNQRMEWLDRNSIIDWVTENAKRYWLVQGGPLQSPEEGGADIVIIDDLEMMGLIPLAKAAAPNRPVLYCSHIQMRNDLIARTGTLENDTWGFVWDHVKHADAFLTYPNQESLPAEAPREKVGYLSPTFDWFDGLNKSLSMWDTGFYTHFYNSQCYKFHMTELRWPSRKYIFATASFESEQELSEIFSYYAEFRCLISDKKVNPPQLVICGNGSIDDPDRKLIYEYARRDLEHVYRRFQRDISIMILGESDQVLNILVRNSHVVLQFSSSEDDEFKVAQALHAGRPIITSPFDGTSIQIQDGVNGFIVRPGDRTAAAEHLMSLFTDKRLHERIDSQVRDLADVAFSQKEDTNVRAATYAEAAQCDIIVITAGSKHFIGQPSMDYTDRNISIVRSIMKEMSPFRSDAIIIVVANPVDLLTSIVQELSGLPRHQVLGSGTFLESIRLRGIVASELKVGITY